VEPPLFYVKNLVLNLNLAYPLSVLALPLAAVAGSQLWPRGKEKMRENSFEMEQTDKKLENPKKTHNRRKPSPKRKAVISKEEEGLFFIDNLKYDNL
jgi:hypothetical protein